MRRFRRTFFAHVKGLEELTGKKLGDVNNPLLVSVRSGARQSMPGMMDTILNLGLNDASVEGLAKKTGNPRFAYDSYRRFVQMFADVVMGVSKSLFEERDRQDEGCQGRHERRRSGRRRSQAARCHLQEDL